MPRNCAGTVSLQTSHTHSAFPAAAPPRPGRWRFLHLAAALAFRRSVLCLALSRWLFTSSPPGPPVPRRPQAVALGTLPLWLQTGAPSGGQLLVSSFC